MYGIRTGPATLTSTNSTGTKQKPGKRYMKDRISRDYSSPEAEPCRYQHGHGSVRAEPSGFG